MTVIPHVRIGAIACLVLSAAGLSACGSSGVSLPSGAPFTASHSCRPSPPSVIALSAVPSSGATGPGFTQFLGKDFGSVSAYEVTHEDVVGGVLLRADHAYVGFVSDAAEHLAEVRALTDDPGYFVAYCAPFSLSQEGTASAEIPRDPVLKAHGIDVLGTAMDDSTGGVAVWVSKQTADVVSLLHQRFGAIIGTVHYGKPPQGIS